MEPLKHKNPKATKEKLQNKKSPKSNSKEVILSKPHQSFIGGFHLKLTHVSKGPTNIHLASQFPISLQDWEMDAFLDSSLIL